MEKSHLKFLQYQTSVAQEAQKRAKMSLEGTVVARVRKEGDQRAVDTDDHSSCIHWFARKERRMLQSGICGSALFAGEQSIMF